MAREKINAGDHVFITVDSDKEKSPWDAWVEELVFGGAPYYEKGIKYPDHYMVISGNTGHKCKVHYKDVFLMQPNEEKYKEMKVISMLPKEQQEVLKLMEKLGRIKNK